MVKNVKLVDLPTHPSDKGCLVAIEGSDSIPFEVARVYYIFGVGSHDRRGFHAHENLDQALICVSGSVKILVEDDRTASTVLLDDPSKGLLIGPMVWREMFDFSSDAVLLVLASRHYDPEDYEKDHESFLSRARDYYEKQEAGR